MSVRLGTALGWPAAGLIAVTLAACTGSSPSAPTTPAPTSAAPSASAATAPASGSAGLRYGDAPALLIQCGLDHGTIKPPAGQPWYSAGKVLPLSGPGSDGRGAELSTWWDAHSSTIVGGKPLSYWQLWAAQHDALPPQVCGTSVSAAALQATIAPGRPDPWDR